MLWIPVFEPLLSSARGRSEYWLGLSGYGVCGGLGSVIVEDLVFRSSLFLVATLLSVLANALGSIAVFVENIGVLSSIQLFAASGFWMVNSALSHFLLISSKTDDKLVGSVSS